MLKKILIYFFCLVLPIVAFFSAVNFSEAVSAKPISLMLEGKDVTALASPVNENGRIFVPIRFISEEMGAIVTWDGVNRTVAVANLKQPSSQIDYLPRIEDKGEKLLVAAFYNADGQYIWFPGPEFSGNKELSVMVRDVRGVVYESSPINVKVDGTPKVLLRGIGPKQVVTGQTKLSVNSNVKLENVS